MVCASQYCRLGTGCGLVKMNRFALSMRHNDRRAVPVSARAALVRCLAEMFNFTEDLRKLALKWPNVRTRGGAQGIKFSLGGLGFSVPSSA